jgi:hypothetical protein
LTGAGVGFWPRPRGRSGCVTTPTTSCRDVEQLRSVGAAKAGVPKKAIRRSDASMSPLAGAPQLLDAAHDQLAVEAAQPIDEERAVEVIHLVLERAREQAGALDRPRRAAAIEPAHHRAFGRATVA